MVVMRQRRLEHPEGRVSRLVSRRRGADDVDLKCVVGWQAKLMIKRKTAKLNQHAELQLQDQPQSESHVKRTLVCVCQPEVFLREGRCMCGYETMLSEEMRKIHSQVPKPTVCV